MKSFYEKEKYTIKDILSLIDNKVEESIHLDFKSKDSLGKSDAKRKEISNDVAAFANSDRGIIVYGVMEQNHFADSITYINGNEFTKEWLEQVINSNVQRKIEGLKIIPVRGNDKIEKSIYVVKIPISDDAPHMSKDKRFYKRYNFESIQMEEFEIRQLYSRKNKSKLLIDQWSIKQFELDDEYAVNLMFEVDIFNEGNVSESDYKVNVIISEYSTEFNVDFESYAGNYDYIILDEKHVKISANSKMPIYPNEFLCAMRFKLKVPKESKELLYKIKTKVILHYSNGQEIKEYNLKKLKIHSP